MLLTKESSNYDATKESSAVVDYLNSMHGASCLCPPASATSAVTLLFKYTTLLHT